MPAMHINQFFIVASQPIRPFVYGTSPRKKQKRSLGEKNKGVASNRISSLGMIVYRPRAPFINAEQLIIVVDAKFNY